MPLTFLPQVLNELVQNMNNSLSAIHYAVSKLGIIVTCVAGKSHGIGFPFLPGWSKIRAGFSYFCSDWRKNEQK